MSSVPAPATRRDPASVHFALGSVADTRPSCCPSCGNPSHPPGGPLGVVGHGTYSRQVCEPGKSLMVDVRRFLCTACDRTFSVLPPALIPRRWYSAAAILMVLTGHLLLAMRASTLAKLYGPSVLAESWRLPGRLAAQLGTSLWAHRAREVGDGPDVPREHLLSRLLGLAGTHARAPAEELRAAAQMLTADPASQRQRAL